MRETATAAIADLPVGDIRPENNDRTVFNQTELQALADSIAHHGLVQPITVRPNHHGDPVPYLLIAGERRWRATQLAGLDTIRAIIDTADDERASDLMLIENTNRANLNPVDEAMAYQSRMDRFGYTVAELSARTGISVSRIATYANLLKLAPELLEAVRSGALTPGMAEAIIGRAGVVLDHNRQLLAYRALVDGDLSIAQLRDVTARLVDEQSQETMFDAADFMQVQEWAAEAKTRRAPKRQILATVADLVDALAAHDPDHPALAPARALIAA